MRKEACPDNNHQWVCKKTTGLAGEISKSSSLTPKEVELITQDPTQATKVCKDGVVVCGKCQQPFIVGQSSESALSNLVQLRPRLTG